MAKRKVAYQVAWADESKQQFYDILEYWNLRNKSIVYSEKLIDIVDEQLSHIAKYPFSSTKTNHPDTRIRVLGHFSIVYKVSKQDIFITAFWDNRQDPAKLREFQKNKRPLTLAKNHPSTSLRRAQCDALRRTGLLALIALAQFCF